jgi:hypothetical protein
MKYCDLKDEVKEEKEFGYIQKEQRRKIKYIWEKRRKRERDCLKFFWKNMTKCFGDGYFDKGQKYLRRKAKKERWKAVAKHKSIKRGNNHRLQKWHINYRLDFSNISHEACKEKWKQTISRRYRLLHPTK